MQIVAARPLLGQEGLWVAGFLARF